MPVYSSEASSLMEKFVEANKVEELATKTLLAFMQSGTKDDALLSSLSDEFEKSHNHKMEIYSELQEFRLDK